MKLQAGITALAVGCGLFALACEQSAPTALPDDAAVPAAPVFKLNHSPPVGPVTITTLIDFTNFPFTGTFAVTPGAGLLGCAGGTFIDLPGPLGHANIAKVLECDGPGTGTFTINFTLGPRPGPGVVNGHWNVLAGRGTGDFALLHGVGKISLVFTGPVTGIETLTGKIHFEP